MVDEIRSVHLDSGTLAVNFPLATTEVWYDKERAKKELTEFHYCVAYGERAKTMAAHVRQGDLLNLEVKIKTESWIRDGVKRYSAKIHIDTFRFVSSSERKKSILDTEFKDTEDERFLEPDPFDDDFLDSPFTGKGTASFVEDTTNDDDDNRPF